MENKIIINVDEEHMSYLQRLGIEVDTKIFLIDQMFANHAQDTDTTLFESIPFQHYMKEYEKSFAQWNLAKTNFQNNYLKEKIKEYTHIDNPNYNWTINDYLSGQCEVTIKE